MEEGVQGNGRSKEEPHALGAEGAFVECTAEGWIPWATFSPPRDHRQFVVGSRTPFDTEITHIYGRSRDHLICMTSDGSLSFFNNDPLPAHLRPAVQEYRRLMVTAKVAFGKRRRETAYAMIAAALGTALLSGEGEDATKPMGLAASFIQTRAADHARSTFVLGVTIVSVIVFIVLHFCRLSLLDPVAGSRPLCSIILGGMAGIVGATISVMQRSKSISCDPFTLTSDATLHGIMRAMLGMVFGGIVVIVAHGGFAFSNVKDNVHALFFMALVAGFSERLIPNLMSRTALGEDPERTEVKQPG